METVSYYGYLTQGLILGEKTTSSHVPRLSCCCVTKDRPDFLRVAIECFLAQSWPNKELIVVTDGGGTDAFREIARKYESGTVRFFTLNGDYPLGHLRNVSLDMCRGDIYVQWDDDDFSHKDRLAIQLAHMLDDRRSFCCFGDQLHLFLEKDQRAKVYWNDWGAPIPGTIMARLDAVRDGGYRYPEEVRRCEDVEFFKDMDRAVLYGYGYLHLYMYHGDAQTHENTFEFNHHLWLRDHHSLDWKHVEPAMGNISDTIQQMKTCGFALFGDGVDVCARTKVLGTIA